MRTYIFGLTIGLLGLVAANQVRADEHCGLRSGKIIEVERWNIEQTKPGKYELFMFLHSNDPKEIKSVSGSIEFFAGKDHILKLPLRFPYRLLLNSEFAQTFKRKKLPVPILAKAPDVTAFACVAAVSYEDGSSVIIN